MDYAIKNQNSHLAKLVLKAGFLVNEGIKIPRTENIESFLTILKNEMTKHGNSKELEELNKIGTLLKKYGCADEYKLISNIIPLSVDKIKQKEYSKILQ